MISGELHYCVYYWAVMVYYWAVMVSVQRVALAKPYSLAQLQSPVRILSDAPKFRAECLQTLRDGEVEEESAAPPSTDAAIASTLLHDFITYLTGEPVLGKVK